MSYRKTGGSAGKVQDSSHSYSFNRRKNTRADYRSDSVGGIVCAIYNGKTN
jgi:hypothetical protein